MGKGGGGDGSKTPQWAQDALAYLIRNPSDTVGPIPGAGLFGDTAAGMNAAPSSSLYQGLGDLPGQAMQTGAYLRNQAGMYGSNANAANLDLSNLGMGGAGGISNMMGQAGKAAGAGTPYMDNLMRLTTMNPNVGGGGVGIPGVMGPSGSRAANAAMGYLQDTGPDSALYQRTLDLMRPNVAAAYSARGMGNTGMAAKAEGDQARQLADSFAQRANAERAAFLGQAVGGEGAAASMTGALGSQNVGLTNAAVQQALGLGGINSDMLRAQMQASLGGGALPSQIYSTLMGGNLQGMQGLGQAAGMNISPLQSLAAQAQIMQGGFGMPLNVSGQTYDVTRAPQLAMLQAAAGAAPLGHGKGGKWDKF